VITRAELTELRDALHPGAVRDDPDLTAGYRTDQANLVAAARPAAVVAPASLAEVQHSLRWARRHRVPVVTRGAGTGLSGGANALPGCLVLSTERLTAVRDIDAPNRTATVEAGVINATLNAAAAPHRLMFAPDPSSWANCTIGGNIATNAGGLRCLRYGATRAAVLGLQVVLADGQAMQTGGATVKRSAGYDLTQLLIGSEGTLAVIVAATVRLQALPGPQVTALATFASLTAAAAAAAGVAGDAGMPTLLELMDATTVAALDRLRGTGFGPDVGAVLLVQLDDAPGADSRLQMALTGQGAGQLHLTRDRAEAEALLDIRRAAYPALQTLGRVLVEDVAVPCTQLPPLIAAVQRIAATSGLTVAVVAHAGDGNAHPLLVVPPGEDGERRAWDAADAIVAAARELGGTVSGEHGIGRLKRRWLADELGPAALGLHRQIKAAFDPAGILNPGAIFDPATPPTDANTDIAVDAGTDNDGVRCPG